MRLSVATVVACFSMITISAAEDVEAASRRHTTIPPQGLATALQQLAADRDIQLVYRSEIVGDRRTGGASGEFTVDEVLAELLSGTGLRYEYLDERAVTIIPASSSLLQETGGGSRSTDDHSSNSFQSRRGEGSAPPDLRAVGGPDSQSGVQESQANQPNEEESERGKRPIEEIVVTGTNIRGIAPESSPVRVFTREDIQISGAGTVQDFVRLMPSNFRGGSNPYTSQGLPNDSNAGRNLPGIGGLGSSVNLRGLGSGSTLVLLNGQRMAPSSGIGDFVDISLIPTSAIERVETLTDGASSIYGSDAVAGVVNFVLRDDFDGVETSLRYGTVTEGDLNQYRASVIGGTSWNTGNALISFGYYKRDDLSAGDRSFSQDLTLPHDLLPSEERHALLGATSQELTSNINLNAHLLYARRKSVHDRTDLQNGGFFHSEPVSKTLSISGGAAWQLSDTWFVDLSGTYSYLHTNANTTGVFFRKTKIDSDLWSADVKVSGDLLSLPGGALKIALGSQFRNESFLNFDVDDHEINLEAGRDVYAFFGEAHIPIFGPTNAVPGIQRLEVHASGRFDHYSDFGFTANPKVGVVWSPVESLRFRGSYSTSFNPPPLGQLSPDVQVSVFPTSFLNSVLGVAAPDPTIADVVEIVVNGTDKNLDAETSRTLTAGLDFEKQWRRHHLTLTATWFDIDFEGRLGKAPVPGGLPSFFAPNVAFTNPDALPEGTVIFSPTLDQINEALDMSDIPVFVFAGDPLDAEIINFAPLTRNLARVLTSGLDLDFTYSFESDNGTFFMGADATYLTNFKQQAAVTTPKVQFLNTLYNPVDLNVRGRVGYQHEGLSANLFVNYTDSYTVDNTAGAMPVHSWTTVDLNLSYDTRDSLNSPILKDTTLRMSVRNLLNEGPPSAPSNEVFGFPGYDPTNASPIGRFIAFELTKQF